ncbi:MAG: C25 family cysteine peptidase, partial [Saprospiraceae bacterium]
MKIVRNILTILFASFIAINIVGAQSPISWIDISKTYYKIKVGQSGIYKLTYDDLVSAGMPTGQVQGSALRMINYGVEQAIYVSDNDFGPGDFIEFYGEKNTIGLDTLLFTDWKKDLFNPEYSLVTDTNTYYLTISPQTSNLRYTIVNSDYSNVTLSPVSYYLHEEKIVYSSTYFKNVDGDIRYSQFEPSEGFGSGIRQTSTIPLNTSMYVESGPLPKVKVRTGQNNQLARFEISWNNQIKQSNIINPKLTTESTFYLEKSELKTSNTINLRNINSANDRHTIAFASVTYPRAFDFGNKTSYEFTLPGALIRRYLEVSSFKSDNKEVVLYDVKQKFRYNTRVSSGKVQILINPGLDTSKYILTNSVDGILKPGSISVFKPKVFANTGQQYVIIAHKALSSGSTDQVKEYADYRRSATGGNYKTEVIDIQDIYDHFGYGIDRHFVSVKLFAEYIKNNWKDARFVLLLGKGVEYPYMRTENDVINNDTKVFFIPTFGFVGSDNMLFSEGNFPDPYFALGRLAARTPEDIKNYLDKVRQY